MKRDFDLILSILRELEQSGGEFPACTTLRSEKGEDLVNEHIILLKEAGLIDAIISGAMGQNIPRATPMRLTWRGHDFLDSARDQTRWEKAKATMNKVGGFSFEVLKAVLVKLATDAALNATP